MENERKNRRDFLKNSCALIGGLVVAAPLAGCVSPNSDRRPSSFYGNGYYGWGYYGSSYQYFFFSPG